MAIINRLFRFKLLKIKAVAKTKSRLIKTMKKIISAIIALLFALVVGFFVLNGSASPTPTAPTRGLPTAVPNVPDRADSGAVIGAAARVELFSFPETDEAILLDQIKTARQRVYMKMYLLTETRVIDALIKAKNNGAEVRAMVEQNPFGGGSTARTAFDKLKAVGINVKYTNPTFRFTHEKSFVIDNAAWILTANMTRGALSGNREFGVIHTDQEDVNEIVRAFEADWNRERFVPKSAALVWSPVNARERITRLIDSANSSITVYCEIAQDDGLIQALTAAQKRGAKVRLLISPASNPDSDGNKDDLDKLQRSKIKVRYLKSPYMHAKTYVVDDKIAFVGSQNISTTSLEFNRELGIVFTDLTAIRLLNEIFDKDWDKATDR